MEEETDDERRENSTSGSTGGRTGTNYSSEAGQRAKNFCTSGLTRTTKSGDLLEATGKVRPKKELGFEVKRVWAEVRKDLVSLYSQDTTRDKHFTADRQEQPRDDDKETSRESTGDLLVAPVTNGGINDRICSTTYNKGNSLASLLR